LDVQELMSVEQIPEVESSRREILMRPNAREHRPPEEAV
jgi:hypothetical protein